MTSKQHTTAKMAAARRAPSLPRRRRWPSPTGANITDRQPRSNGGAGRESVLSIRSSATRTNCLSGVTDGPDFLCSGQDHSLLMLELGGGDRKQRIGVRTQSEPHHVLLREITYSGR